ncbi:hypothetical protein GCM10010428_00980 [Actinosynnema pretiosum subsp. pretiosum]
MGEWAAAGAVAPSAVPSAALPAPARKDLRETDRVTELPFAGGRGRHARGRVPGGTGARVRSSGAVRGRFPGPPTPYARPDYPRSPAEVSRNAWTSARSARSSASTT